jgi:hypothetical protein
MEKDRGGAPVAFGKLILELLLTMEASSPLSLAGEEETTSLGARLKVELKRLYRDVNPLWTMSLPKFLVSVPVGC